MGGNALNFLNILQYDSELDRWYATFGEENDEEIDMHCGDTFIMELEEHLVHCRIEMDTDWYIISGNKRLRLHPKEKYRIKFYRI